MSKYANAAEEWEQSIVPNANQLPVDDAPAKKKKYGNQKTVWGDDIPLADTLTAINAARSAKNKKRKDTQRIGRNSEGRAKRVLIKMGFINVKKLSTKWNGTFSLKAKADFEGKWHDEALSDARRKMLCEVKHTEHPRLTYGALRKHQTKNLTDLARRNGIALLIWTYEKEKFVLWWGSDGIDGFVKGTSIKIEQARELSIISGPVKQWRGQMERRINK